MAKDWGDRWGSETLIRKRSRNQWSKGKAPMQSAVNAMHFKDKSKGEYSVLITKTLVKQLNMYKSIGVHTPRINKLITCKSACLAIQPHSSILLDYTKIEWQWVSARYINKDTWEFYLE